MGPDNTQASTPDANSAATSSAAPAAQGTDTQAPTAAQPAAPPAAPQAAPAQQSPQQNAPQGQTDQNQQPNQAGKQPDLSKPMQPTQPTPQQIQQQKQQQQIDNAGHFYKVAQALAGGARYKTTIDPNTGATTRVPVPLSRGDIGMAIAAEVLSGGLAGLAQRGPGAEGRAAEAGFQQVSQQQQDAQKQQEQQAQQAFKNQSEQLARRASTYEANSRAIMNTSQAEQMGAEAIDKLVDINRQSGVLDVDPSLTENGGQPMTQQELMDAMKSGKISPTDQLGPVTGRVEVTNPDGSKRWEATHLVIKDPNTPISLTQEQWDRFADAGVPGYAKGSKIGSGIDIPLRMMQNANEIAASHMLVNQRLDDLRGVLGKTDEGKLIPKSIDFTAPGVNTAVQHFQKYVSHNADNLNDPYLALQQMGADKRNPKTGLMEPNPDAKYADTIAQQWGGWNVLQAAHNKILADKDAAKKTADREALYDVIDTADKANAVLADPKKFTGEQVAAAQKFRAIGNSDASSKAYSEASARTQAEVDTKKRNGIPLFGGGGVGDLIKDPNIQNIKTDQNEQPVNGVRQGYFSQLQTVSPQVASLVKSLGEGRTVMSNYGLARGDGQMLAAILTQAYPSYDQSKSPSYQKARESFTSGKDKTQIDGLNTAFVHSSRAYSNAGSELAVIPGNTTYADYQEDIGRLKEEINNAYTNGVLHDEERKNMSSRLDSTLPWVRKESIKEVLSLMSDKATQMQQDWRRGKPSSAVPDFQIMSPEAQAAFQNVTGNTINPYGLVQGADSGNKPYVPPAGAMRRADGHGGYNYKLTTGQVVDNNGNPAQTQ